MTGVRSSHVRDSVQYLQALLEGDIETMAALEERGNHKQMLRNVAALCLSVLQLIHVNDRAAILALLDGFGQRVAGQDA